MRDVKVKIGNLTMSKRVVKPPETVVIKLTKERLEKLEKKAKLVVSIEKGKK